METNTQIHSTTLLRFRESGFSAYTGFDDVIDAPHLTLTGLGDEGTSIPIAKVKRLRSRKIRSRGAQRTFSDPKGSFFPLLP